MPEPRFPAPERARLQQIYERTAAFYDDVVAEHQAAAKLEAIRLLGRSAGERVLEVGMGTGWAFSRLIAHTGAFEAWGLEVAPGMLSVARRRLGPPSDGWPALLLGDIEHLPFRDDSFDCLLCTYTLECLPPASIAAGLREMRRVLAPGGRAVVADLTPGEGEDAAFSEEWQRGYEADPEYYGGARPLQLKPLLEDAGYRVVERLYSGHGAGWPSEAVLAQRAA